MHSLSQTADNQTDVRWQYDPESKLTTVILEGPSMWQGDTMPDAMIAARFTPDQMRSVVAFWQTCDPGDAWTTSPPST